MPPIELDPHSCRHCQNFVIYEQSPFTRERSDNAQERLYERFNYTVTDILAAADEECSFCSWILDNEEWIPRSAFVDWVSSSPRFQGSEDQDEFDGILQLQFRLDSWLPVPNPANTLRSYCTEDQDDQIHGLRLACFYNDALTIKFFGLWNLTEKRTEYRTRTGFSFFTQLGNPASRIITTRPIESESGSDETFRKVSAWLDECLHRQLRGQRIHPDCPNPSPIFMPTRLVEISAKADQYRLNLWESQSSVTEPYVALSYCWGGDQPFKLSEESLNECRADIPFGRLPQTIKDAIMVTHKLGFRFLWIDSMCIIQDNANDKAVEIARMPHIYRNSTVTIAASQAATVYAGFLGNRIATDAPESVFKLPFQCRTPGRRGSITLIKATIAPEPLDSRAWAMQERLLSPRTIEFASRQLRFICQQNPRGITDGWRLNAEGNEYRMDNLDAIAVINAEVDAHSDTQAQISAIDFEEGMRNWSNLVEVYTHKHLTLSADRILAISGLAQRFGVAFGDQYCVGMWRSTFPRSLLWERTGKLRCRPEVWQGPSWSWTSITGPVSFGSGFQTAERSPVVTVSIDLANADNPYGALLEGSGRLTLKTRIRLGLLRFIEDDVFGLIVIARGFMVERELKAFTVRVSYDALDATEEERDANNVLLVEISSICGERDWSCSGLVVRRVSEDTYTRVGTFNYKTDGTNHRQESESLEEWHKRALRDLSWFSGERAKVIDII